jgi:hypothetical protein
MAEGRIWREFSGCVVWLEAEGGRAALDTPPCAQERARGWGTRVGGCGGRASFPHPCAVRLRMNGAPRLVAPCPRISMYSVKDKYRGSFGFDQDRLLHCAANGGAVRRCGRDDVLFSCHSLLTKLHCSTSLLGPRPVGGRGLPGEWVGRVGLRVSTEDLLDTPPCAQRAGARMGHPVVRRGF